MKKAIVIKLLFISILVILGNSCKKYSKELTTVNFHLYNPVTNEGYANVKVQIIQQEDVTGAFQVESEYESTVIWEGVTDANGKTSYSFNAMKKDKFTYWQSVDDGFKVGKNIILQPDYKPLNINEINEINYKILKYINLINWIKNDSCIDVNDKMRFRRKSIINIYDNWSNWIPNGPNGYYEGCMNYFTNSYTHTQDIWDVEMEVTKNAITTIQRDTFYLTGQNGIDTLKLFY